MVLAAIMHQLMLVALLANQAFCYGSLLCCFFLERVSSLRPCLFVEELGPRVPRMVRQAWMILRTRGVDPEIERAFSLTSLELWYHRIGQVEQFYYFGMDFQ